MYITAHVTFMHQVFSVYVCMSVRCLGIPRWYARRRYRRAGRSPASRVHTKCGPPLYMCYMPIHIDWYISRAYVAIDVCVCIYAGGMHSHTSGHGASASSPQARRRSLCGRMVYGRSQDRGPSRARYIREGKGHCSIAPMTCYVYTCAVCVVTPSIVVEWYVCDVM